MDNSGKIDRKLSAESQETVISFKIWKYPKNLEIF